MSSRVEYVGCAHDKLAKSFLPRPKQLFFFLLMALVWCRLLDWMIGVWGNKTHWPFNNFFLLTNGGLSHMWRNPIQPPQPCSSSPYWSPAESHSSLGRFPIHQTAFLCKAANAVKQLQQWTRHFWTFATVTVFKFHIHVIFFEGSILGLILWV